MIRFACPCGRTLNAPERLAGRPARCPACGTSCSVPSPATAGTERGVGVQASREDVRTEKKELRSRKETRPSDRNLPVHTYIDSAQPPAEDPSSEYTLAPVSAPEWVPSDSPKPDPNYSRTAFFEPHPSDYWLGKSARRKFVGRLAGLQAFVSALAAGFYPYVIESGFAWMNGVFFALVLAGLLGLLIGYVCVFLNAALLATMRGKDSENDPPEIDAASAASCFARWLLSFLCGPAVLLALAFYYGIHCGDVGPVDVIIVIELTLPAMTYWVIGLLVLAKHPEQTCPAPRQVLQEIRRLGWRAFAAGLFATAVLFVLAGWGAFALMALNEAWIVGITLLAIEWFVFWNVATSAMQTLGSWHRNSLKSPAPAQVNRATA